MTVQAAALLQDAGSDQLLWSVLSHHALSKPRCGICSAAKKKEVKMKHFEQWVRLPILLLVSVYSQQVTPFLLSCSLPVQQC